MCKLGTYEKVYFVYIHRQEMFSQSHNYTKHNYVHMLLIILCAPHVHGTQIIIII